MYEAAVRAEAGAKMAKPRARGPGFRVSGNAGDYQLLWRTSVVP